MLNSSDCRIRFRELDMPSPTNLEIAPGKAILINEAAAATGVPARKINRLIDDAVLPRSACVKLGSRRAVRAYAVPMVSFGATDGSKLSKGTRLKAMRVIEKFARENWPRLLDDPEHARPLRFESGCVMISLGGERGDGRVEQTERCVSSHRRRPGGKRWHPRRARNPDQCPRSRGCTRRRRYGDRFGGFSGLEPRRC